MTVPNNPESAGYGAPQPGPGGYQQPPQQGWAPSAYSAPAPGQDAYGHQVPGYQQPGVDQFGYQAYQAPRSSGGFAAAFSTNFSIKGGQSLAKIAQIFAIIVGIAFASYGLFLLLGTLTRGGYEILQVLVYLSQSLAYILLGLFLPAFSRVLLEKAVESPEKQQQ